MLRNTKLSDQEELKADIEFKDVKGIEKENISLVYQNKKIEYLRDFKADTTHSGTVITIFQATYENRPVAIREMSMETCRDNFGSPETLHAQVIALKKIDSPYLVTPKFDFIQIKPGDSGDSVYYCQVMEYINGCSLQSYCCSPAAQKISLLRMYTIAYQIAQGVAALHSQNPPLVHCDLYEKNILLDKNLNAKIIDFDYLGPAGKRNIWLTERRIAPEQEASPPLSFSTQTDIYSLGKIFLLLVTRQNSFDGLFRFDEVRAKSSPEFARLIQSCLATNPKKRPTAQQICIQLREMMIPKMTPKMILPARKPSPHPSSLFGSYKSHCQQSLIQSSHWLTKK